MSIRIITDSASEVEQNEFHDVTVVPMTIIINDKVYKDGVDMSKNEFFDLLEQTDTMPATSLINEYEWGEIYKNVTEAGDEAIVITLSSGLSGTFQSAKNAAEEFENISVIDSQQVTVTQKMLVLRCRELIATGMSREEIVAKLEEEKKELVLLAALDTLKYLLKGGRISKTSALVGGIIGIKPILTMVDGKLVPLGKAKGSKNSHIFLNKKVEELGGIDFSRPYCVGFSGTDNSNLLRYMEDNKVLMDSAPKTPDIVQIGSTVGTHAGPGGVIVTFFKKHG